MMRRRRRSTTRPLRVRRGLLALTAGTFAIALAVGLLVAGHTGATPGGAPGRVPPLPGATTSASRSTAPSSPPDRQLSRATAMPAVTATTTPADLPADVMAQPDLFARAFVTRLLTQDYRQPRTELLGWVQAHAAQSTDPLVMGLIPPDLRDKWAVFSVTDPGSGPAPVPSATEWDRLAGRSARTSVQIQHVSQPYSWTSAVATGRITDPGVTGREVTALVTLHTVDDGSPHTATTSVALSFNLEGPPTRDHWGFVTLAAYTVVPLAGS